ncbi:hypothetical protein HKX48_001202 [Thoreauomyces humboldtii]|nr:hypothetical protein HKX48_001202 [Thoreauomyces humboldtii]
MLATSLLLATLGAQAVSAHMMLGIPEVWGPSDKSDLENPLTQDTQNWFCHGQSQSLGSGTLDITPGGTLSIPIVCGAAQSKPGNAQQICGGDPDSWHSGGGSALSIAYKATGAKAADFYMFSQVAKSPYQFTSANFHVPANLPATDAATCAWTWIPAESANEIYMNCFDCRVLGGSGNGTITGGTKLTDHLWALPGFPATANRPLYKNVLPDGALSLTVTGSAAAAPSLTVSSAAISSTTGSASVSTVVPVVSVAPISGSSSSVTKHASPSTTASPDVTVSAAFSIPKSGYLSAAALFAAAVVYM